MFKVMLLALISSIISGLSYGLHAVAIPFLFEEVDVFFWQFGLVESISLGLSSLILFKSLGVSSKIVGVVSAVSVTLFRVLLALSYSVVQVLIAYIIVYIGASLYSIIVISTVLESVKHYRATALGLLSSARFIVSSVSPLLGAFLIGLIGVRYVLLLNALLAVSYIPIAFEFSKVPERREVGVFELFRNHRFPFLFVAVMALGGFPGGMYMVFEGIIGVYIGDFSAWVIGAYITLESISITLAAPLAGFLVDRIARRYIVPIVNDLLNIPYAFAILYGAISRNPFLYLAAPIPDALMSATSTASTAILKDLNAPSRQLVTLSSALGNLSAVFGIFVSGFLLDFYGVHTTLSIIIVVSLIIVYIDLLLLPKLYMWACR